MLKNTIIKERKGFPRNLFLPFDWFDLKGPKRPEIIVAFVSNFHW